ncbi:uncharacterized protein LOC128236608 [Mya arenaria]|uniref:uncharacterized protein LOC128236608 n=1 Tax=Mya arenaria TaxID=6604 RepID=UPI0022E4DBB9|nr:uncharacterized protein LOC128236608 [Mya arenaria]XP_052807544.1 uncharacterized protein LOC128236608 [Mya arenaria]XP_052807545.1 uncharacterized protein LOC128236608 [Mya arenaria]
MEIDKVEVKLDEAQQTADLTRKMSRDILQNLQELNNQPGTCPCSDDLRDAQTALAQLNSRVKLLNETNREKEGRFTELQTQLWDLRNAFNKLQTDMLDRREKTTSNQNHCPNRTTTSARADNTDSHSEALYTTSYQESKNCGVTQPSSNSKSLQKEKIDVETPATGNEASSDNPLSFKDDVVRQRVKAYKSGLLEWHSLALREGKFDSRTDSNGIRNVVLIDISESIVNGWTQVKTFFNGFLSGLASSIEFGINQERVAIATFGHETKVQQKLTGDIGKLKSAFEKISLGGPTPLAAGLLMSLAAVGSFERTGSIAVVNGTELHSRIIIVTDGCSTETDLYMGPDVADDSKLEETKQGIISILERMRGRKLELCFVPVGNANQELINFMAGVVKGKIYNHQDGNKLARRTLDTVVKGQSLGGVLPGLFDGENLEQKLKEMQENSEKLKELLMNAQDSPNPYSESTGSNLPALGSRVSRGPDWNYSDDQDKWMPGTIVGHTSDDQVWVDWDAPNTGVGNYRYGLGGAYDVIIIDEGRTLEDGETLAVGCKVRPGIGFKNSATNIGSQTIGTVLRIKLDRGQPKAVVRWGSGQRGEYTYIAHGSTQPEVELVSQ